MSASSAPFTGRTRERALLDSLVADLERAESRSLVIAGAPGIGKTTMLERFKASKPTVQYATCFGVESEMELQVAQMAAAGLSNREIAEQLYLSHRTAASHLYRIYPKLGITSRNQLHLVLGGGEVK